MNLPPAHPTTRRFQTAVLWVCFTDTLTRSPLALAVFCDMVQRVLLTLGLGGVVLQEGRDIVLALEGREADIDRALTSLRTSRHVHVVIPWRLSITEMRYRPLVLARPVLTAGERSWLRLEIECGFSNLHALPTLLDWLALRQAHPGLSLQSEALVRRIAPTRRKVSAEILQFQPRSS